MQVVRVRVPCSTSNLGAGFDCIGLALNRYLTATLYLEDAKLEIERTGTLTEVVEDNDRDLVANGLRAAGCEPRGRLQLDSTILVGRGLGSSAAATVAGLMLAARLRNEPAKRKMIAGHATELEGHPDNAVPATFGGLMGAIREMRNGAAAIRIQRLRLADTLRFVFAAPQALVSTKAARRALPQQVPHAVASRSIARSLALIEGLAAGEPDLLRIGFTDELHVPYRLPLIPGGSAAIQAANEAGAYAATISGSGSGLLAVCGQECVEAVADAMQDALERATTQASVAFPVEPDQRGAQYLDA